MDELKKCPFCGKDHGDHLRNQEAVDKCWLLKFIETYVYGTTKADGDGARDWNRRPLEDALTAEVARLTERIGELTEQANDAYAPYREQTERLTRLLDMKQDALASYAEFYDKSAALAGYPGANPATETDEIILRKIAQGRGLEIENARLREALTKIMLTAKSWEGRKEAPYWNLGDIASNALGTKED